LVEQHRDASPRDCINSGRAHDVLRLTLIEQDDNVRTIFRACKRCPVVTIETRRRGEGRGHIHTRRLVGRWAAGGQNPT
jgi:hypothetical protein